MKTEGTSPLYRPATALMAVVLLNTVLVGCSTDDPSVAPSGSLSLAVNLVSGIEITNVDYTISGNGIGLITGTIDVNDPGATVSATISAIPPGTGYEIALNAVSVDGKR